GFSLLHRHITLLVVRLIAGTEQRPQHRIHLLPKPTFPDHDSCEGRDDSGMLRSGLAEFLERGFRRDEGGLVRTRHRLDREPRREEVPGRLQVVLTPRDRSPARGHATSRPSAWTRISVGVLAS